MRELSILDNPVAKASTKSESIEYSFPAGSKLIPGIWSISLIKAFPDVVLAKSFMTENIELNSFLKLPLIDLLLLVSIKLAWAPLKSIPGVDPFKELSNIGTISGRALDNKEESNRHLLDEVETPF